MIWIGNNRVFILEGRNKKKNYQKKKFWKFSCEFGQIFFLHVRILSLASYTVQWTDHCWDTECLKRLSHDTVQHDLLLKLVARSLCAWLIIRHLSLSNCKSGHSLRCGRMKRKIMNCVFITTYLTPPCYLCRLWNAGFSAEICVQNISETRNSCNIYECRLE